MLYPERLLSVILPAYGKAWLPANYRSFIGPSVHLFPAPPGHYIIYLINHFYVNINCIYYPKAAKSVKTGIE